MSAATTTRNTTIIESADGKTWTWAQYGRQYKTLAAAMRADDRDAKRLTEAAAVVVTVREIIPNTAAGALIARTLAS